MNDTQIAQLSQSLEGAECSYFVLAARGLGTALLTVWDIGLSPPASTSALVRNLLNFSYRSFCSVSKSIHFLSHYF